MPTYVRRDLEGSAEPCSRARPELIEAPAHRGFAPADVTGGYSREELEAHANEQLRASSAANSHARLARVRQPQQALRANSSRVVFQRQSRGLGTAPADAHREDGASTAPAEPSTT